MLELKTTSVHDHEIDIPNIQDFPLLKMIHVQICSNISLVRRVHAPGVKTYVLPHGVDSSLEM
jgi:hypothetical protein